LEDESPILARGDGCSLAFGQTDPSAIVGGIMDEYKGDALIVVAYDWVSRPSEGIIDSTDIWVRFYDVPEALMTMAGLNLCC
jgi:hypothetical protein